jgi:pyridoxamine 5'-phosphate oxidase
MLSPTELAALRQEYSERGLRRSELDPDPIVQFNHWLHEARERELIEPNAMTVSTVDAAGQPWSRTLLLKICDARGFIFFTNYEGAKGHQLAGNPRAAITFWWGALERQVNISGTVTKVSREESEAYFHSRPVTSQLGAWASQQSSVVESRDVLEQRYRAAAEQFGHDEVPLPDFWGGYLLRPATIEFWQGRRSRLHDRLRYTRQPDDAWMVERLSP